MNTLNINLDFGTEQQIVGQVAWIKKNIVQLSNRIRILWLAPGGSRIQTSPQAELLAGVFGAKACMARRAEQATLPAKAVVVRANGAKGSGGPRKRSAS